jgi:hypothetical protein
MTTVIFFAVAMAVVPGLGLKYLLDRLRSRNILGELQRITLFEYALVAGLMTVVIIPTVTMVGKKMSVNKIVTYEQFLNGIEIGADPDTTVCYGGKSGNSASSGQSNCEYTYVSGSYSYDDTYLDEECSTDSNGNQTCNFVTKCCVTEHADIHTPYATTEATYSIRRSVNFKEIEPFYFKGTYIGLDAKQYGKKPIPANLPRGAPPDWLDAKAHLDAGDARGFTTLGEYPNYILASGDEVLAPYSADIDRYLEANMLPAHTAGIMKDPITGPSKSVARKLSFVGMTVPNEAEWQAALMRFNAALGLKLQGDLHVVMVDSTKVTTQESVTYLNALKAYWQGPTFGKRALAKNGVILAIGVADNSSVAWAEASTGMPFGNEGMAQYIRDNLPGTAFTPAAIFGSPRTALSGKKVSVALTPTRGALEHIMFEQAPFARPSMSCEDDEDGCVGYKDLLSTIEPTRAQKTWMLVITTVLALGLWLVVGFTSIIEILFPRLMTRHEALDTPEDSFDLYAPYRNSGHGNINRKGKNR